MQLNYDLETESLKNEINLKKYNSIVLQFPDGLKQYAKEIVDNLEKNTKNCDFFIYFGTCYGGCDIPFHLKILNIDLIVQYGHSEFIKK